LYLYQEKNMPLNIIIGTQWGDEGKGRIVDLLSAEADLVARYAGGDNAGHTVTVGEKIFKLHLVPSGIIHPHTFCVLGNGMVINPETLLHEIETLHAAGIEVSPQRMVVSYAAHLITPFHRLLDQAQDEARGKDKIGTTGRGIGPAYVDKAARRGIRAQDTLDPSNLSHKLEAQAQEVDRQLRLLFHHGPLELVDLVEKATDAALLLAPYVGDVGKLVRQALKEGKNVVAEGAQGTLLDLDQGSYPFVTSSTTTAAGVFSGLGLGITPVNRVLGVTKAFQTRVGSGPFPTELHSALAGRLRGTGTNPWDEFGTTTGRPRRVGWLDAPLLRYAVAINGLTELAVTKLDILSGFKQLKICQAYRVESKEFEFPPSGLESSRLETCEPVYEELPGWDEDVRAARCWNDLPARAQAYIRRLESVSGVPVKMVSVGPERDQVVML
jgi:adenylosuccinate synthase